VILTITVAQDLTAIVDMAERLEDQAINDANDHLMPGGLAMVALAPTANLEAWAHKLDAAERRGIHPVIEDDDDWEPPLQTLLFWSEDLRRIHDQEFEPTPYRPRPSEATEANVIRHHLNWLWENEPKWNDFAADIGDVRKRMEALLTEGLRSKRGVPCLSIDCEGGILVQPVADRRRDCGCGSRPVGQHAEHARCDCPFSLRLEYRTRNDGLIETTIVRVYAEALIPNHVHPLPNLACVACQRETEWGRAHAQHDRGGLRDEWVCGTCDRRYGIEDYRRAVAQSAFLNAEWLPLEDAIARTGAKRGSIQGWATRGHVRRRKDAETGRVAYNVADIEARRAGEVIAS
jgi:hypothetical protein